MPPAFSFTLAEGIRQRQPVLPRLAAFEASRPHPPAGLGPGLIDGADKPVVFAPPKLGAMAVLHPHVEPAIHLGQGFARDRARSIFRQDGDVAGMGTEAAGAAGDAVRGSGRQSMDQKQAPARAAFCPQRCALRQIQRCAGARNGPCLRRRKKREGIALPPHNP